jgi:hypothetical protein
MTFNNQIQSQKYDIDDAIKEVSGIPPKIKEAIPKGKKGIGNFKSVSDFLVENTNKYNIEDIRSWFAGRFDSTMLEQKFKPHNDVNTIDEYCNDIYYEAQSGVNRKDLSKDERTLIRKINDFGVGLKGICTFKDLYNSVDLWLYPGYVESNNDLLGVYQRDLKVGLFIDEIDKVAEDAEDKGLLSFLELDKDKFTSYLIGYVYIHELFHRYYDLFHEEAIKTTVPQIEEPMAELGALVSIEEMVSQKLFDKSFFKVAYQQVYAKCGTDKYYHYSLGSTLFDKGYGKELIEHYVRVSSLFDVNEDEVKKYKSCLRSNKNDLNGLAEMLAEIIMSKKSNSTLQPTYNVVKY